MARPISHSLMLALRGCPEFASLSDSELLDVVGMSANLRWKAGQVVFEKDSAADGLYIVLNGRVQIFDADDADRPVVAEAGPGESFGELSLLLHTTHTLGARAVEDTELMVVTKSCFQELMATHPDLAKHFRRKLSERLPGLKSG
ncbi:MAG TPA: cyclic nucleotide-binding domain-containing protein [Actinomycetota bacterium]|nr:cyclic nucleotide-binding domain-containing protein [Actinomycetota bacterium]